MASVEKDTIQPISWNENNFDVQDESYKIFYEKSVSVSFLKHFKQIQKTSVKQHSIVSKVSTNSH